MDGHEGMYNSMGEYGKVLYGWMKEGYFLRWLGRWMRLESSLISFLFQKSLMIEWVYYFYYLDAIRDIYEPLIRTSSQIVRLVAASG